MYSIVSNLLPRGTTLDVWRGHTHASSLAMMDERSLVRAEPHETAILLGRVAMGVLNPGLGLRVLYGGV